MGLFMIPFFQIIVLLPYSVLVGLSQLPLSKAFSHGGIIPSIVAHGSALAPHFDGSIDSINQETPYRHVQLHGNAQAERSRLSFICLHTLSHKKHSFEEEGF
jgi:hypothetical protein